MPVFERVFGRAFSGRHRNRVLVVFEPTRIAFSQVYPFLMYADAFAARFDAEFRFLPCARAMEGIGRAHREASHVVLQTWRLDGPEQIETLRDRIDAAMDRPRQAYFDGFANCDLRFARHLQGIDLYYRKSLFCDLRRFQEPTRGHTNLTDYYSALYDLRDAETDWQVPSDILPRLRLSANFLTAPELAHGFLGSRPRAQDDAHRDIDLHARLGGTTAQSWYGEMRRNAETRAIALGGIVGSGISMRAFMDELGRSKLCFSPFGYGEICWRDIEAMLCGAVLLKPDMSHLRTEPDLYRDDETYVALRWDFADLEDKVQALLADAPRRARIAQAAWDAARDYLRSNGPLETYRDIFAAH
jgi:hypothetical protein